MFTLHACKFSLSGALLLLLDLQRGSTGEGSAVLLGETDLGGPAEEEAILTGVTGALLVLTVSVIGWTQDGVGNWNVIRDLITLELKRLSSSTKMMTVSPKCSTLVSGYQV